ncbi:GHKL domain-containing protein [Cytobacillus firmus]|uniref:two-component system sensor histidine kinase NtrB n=1 Tax=Cytobacillus firmus TaxID=1399 RepID=UPI002188B9C4|nr:ATP-binding protein [Cytobacillus firmus]URM31384.1 GHKL domain-containing protein [Cytobacillus firmus]
MKYIKKSEREIRENDRQLAAALAHEIRNPLTTVKGFMELLKPYLIEIGKEQYAQIAIDEINRANDLIYEFLNASKPGLNKKTEIDINKLIQEMKISFDNQANINLSVNLCPGEPIIYGDSNKIKQLLINVIKNALEACEEAPAGEGKVCLNAKSNSRKAQIIIEDNGPGMTEETINRLFLPFYTTKEKGTGIGLSICRKIIEEHNGSIKVHSTLSQGSVFTIELPMASNQ